MDQQRLADVITPVTMMMPMNSNTILQMEQYPDMLQHFPIDQCKILFEALALTNNPSLVNKSGSVGGYTALHWMCIKNELELIEFLIVKCKADVNSKGSMGETPLFVCIKNCNFLAIELLIKHGADLNARDVYNRSVIHWTAYTGKVVLMYYFQKYYGLNDLNDVDQFEQNAMHIACASGFQELIRYLIEHGNINLYAQDCNGNTCLHMAAKCGLPRLCWLITQKYNGEAVRLIGVLNKQNQTAFDIIRNEYSPNYKKIRNWLRLEAKTNEYLLDKSYDLNSLDKKASSPSALKIKPGTSFFKWNSHRRMQAELLFHFFTFPLALTVPMLIYSIFFDKNKLSLWQGLIGYSSFIGIFIGMTHQKHRIDHISGMPNPFNLGLFSFLFMYNYTTYYLVMIDSFNILRFSDFFIVCGTLWHFYSSYRIYVDKPGFAQESIKKTDGTPYDLRDLMKLNTREDSFTTRDSVKWLTDTNYKKNTKNPSQYVPQVYFCEYCLIIQSEPTKHCKLCEGCCCRFDHHCIFITKCVGLKNHRSFIYFLISSIIAIIIFLLEFYTYSVKSLEKLNYLNIGKTYDQQISAFYFFLSSQNNIWVTTLAAINGFSLFGTFFLLAFQLRFIALGFTTQFGPPSYFIKLNKRMKSFPGAILFRLSNLYIFFFGTHQELLDLYYRQQKEHALAYAANNNHLAPLYPRDNIEKGQDFLGINHTNAKTY